MAYIFHQDDLPRLLSKAPGRERVFFASKELSDMDDMLAGVMYYEPGSASPLHYHANCEHFYFIFDGEATVEETLDVVIKKEEESPGPGLVAALAAVLLAGLVQVRRRSQRPAK